MKRMFIIAVLLLWVILGMGSHSIAQDRKYLKLNWAGYGIPYGGIPGINIELSPIEYLGISAGLGYNTPVGVGWAVGTKIYLLGQDNNFRPYLSAHHGVVTTVKKQEKLEYAHGVGNAYGIGLELHTSTDVGIHLIDFTAPDGYEEWVSRGWRTISIGVGFYF